MAKNYVLDLSRRMANHIPISREQLKVVKRVMQSDGGGQQSDARKLLGDLRLRPALASGTCDRHADEFLRNKGARVNIRLNFKQSSA